MIDIQMPQMGESIVEGTLTKWLKKPGDRVERDEPIFEISTDKVDTEIPSPAAGTLAEILVQEGTTVGINTVVARISDGSISRDLTLAADSANFRLVAGGWTKDECLICRWEFRLYQRSRLVVHGVL
jgi:2-oxoglutarate dehydrogenase E2 component (dihydrolipoamide succinyltransferase)